MELGLERLVAGVVGVLEREIERGSAEKKQQLRPPAWMAADYFTSGMAERRWLQLGGDRTTRWSVLGCFAACVNGDEEDDVSCVIC